MGPRKHVLGWMHTDATWQMPLNRTCAAMMRPFCPITLTSCCLTVDVIVLLTELADGAQFKNIS